jgi:uncharacterized protein YndB with AHSA1/START domain
VRFGCGAVGDQRGEYAGPGRPSSRRSGSYRLLSYRWHTFQPEHAERFGWSPEQLAEMRQEQLSTVTFEIEQVGDAVRLTVTHDDFEPGSEMLKRVSEGWPAVLSQLKTFLETGKPLQLAAG